MISFIAVVIWNWFDPWPAEWWSIYFFITLVVVGIIVGSVSTVWFMIGGIVDLRALFRDLASRKNNPLDDGWVVGHVSLVDAEELGTEEEKKEALEEEAQVNYDDENVEDNKDMK